MDSALLGLILTVVGAVMTYIIKGFFTNLEARINKHERETDNKLHEVNIRLDALNDGYSKIFNELLAKFSNWEDRIKSTLDELMRKQITGSIKDVNDLAEIAFRDFDKKTQNELSSLKKEIDNIDKGLKSVERVVSGGSNHSTTSVTLNPDTVNSLKASLASLRTEIQNVQNNSSKSYDEMRDKIATLLTVCKAVNADCRRLDDKVKLILEESKQKISLR